ncbi:MAG: DinB family protein, partial [Acidobacteriota bacterium]
MAGSDPPHRRDELSSLFEALHREAAELFTAPADEAFFRSPEEGVWSAAENVVHLVKSVQAVAGALKVPKLVLTMRFGTAKASRAYGEIHQIYKDKLQQGAVATGPYVPQIPTPATPEEAQRSRTRALAGWQRAGESLVRELGKWSEAALDKHRLPHPLLGKLTVREMLFFTHFHDLHHIAAVRRCLEPGG